MTRLFLGTKWFPQKSRFLWINIKTAQASLEKLSCRHRIRYLAMIANICNRCTASTQRVEYALADEHILPSSVHPILWLQGIDFLNPFDGSGLLLTNVDSTKACTCGI